MVKRINYIKYSKQIKGESYLSSWNSAHIFPFISFSKKYWISRGKNLLFSCNFIDTLTRPRGRATAGDGATGFLLRCAPFVHMYKLFNFICTDGSCTMKKNAELWRVFIVKSSRYLLSSSFFISILFVSINFPFPLKVTHTKIKKNWNWIGCALCIVVAATQTGMDWKKTWFKWNAWKQEQHHSNKVAKGVGKLKRL